MANPKCPHCKHKFSDEEIYYEGSNTDFPLSNDGDVNETECSSCERKLTIVLQLNPEWQFLNEASEEI